MPNAYANTEATSYQVTSLMRRINALEAGVSAGGSETFAAEWGNVGSSIGDFQAPRGIAVLGGEIYCSDAIRDKIIVFNASGAFSREFSVTGGVPSVLDLVAYGGEIYGIDAGSTVVRVYDSAGTLRTLWGNSTWFSSPRYLTVYNGEVYVTDTARNKVIVFDTSGTYQREFGTAGTSTGQMWIPYGITVLGGYLYVVQGGRDKVTIFSTSGTFQSEFGTSGSGAGEITNGVDIGAYGSEVYLVDAGRKRVLVFNSAGAFQREFGETGTTTGKFNEPAYITFLGGSIYVMDSNRKKVLLFTSAVGVPQTTFYSYTEVTKTSLGTPDGGVSVPDYNALYANEADLVLNHITDMRTAIQALAPFYTNPATSNPYNWTSGSADNLYCVAMGDRTAYGATGGVRYDWTRSEAQMNGDFAYDIDIGEIDSCIAQLEAS